MSLPLLQCHSLTWFVHDHVFPTLLVPRRMPEQTRIEVRMVTYHLETRDIHTFSAPHFRSAWSFWWFSHPWPIRPKLYILAPDPQRNDKFVRTFQKVWGIPAFSFSGVESGWHVYHFSFLTGAKRREFSGMIQITLLRVIPTMTFQNSLLTPLLSEAFVTGLLPN